MLRQRVVTAVIGLLVIVTILVWGSLPWHVMVWLGTLGCACEFTAMIGNKWYSLLTLWACVIVTIVEWIPGWHTLTMIQLGLGLTLLWPVVTRNKVQIAQAAVVLVGGMYIGYGGLGLIKLRNLHYGLAWILLFLVCIWMTDTSAFFAGSRLKGPKLWPAISPKKTVSGAVAGALGAAAGAILVGFVTVPGFDILSYATVGVVISVAGQLGDLVESAYKRSAGVKDSGKFLPGHGGLLDRVDSMLFAAPLAYYLITTGATTWFQ